MRKYMEVAKLMFKAQLSWRMDIAASTLITVAKILFAMIVWGAVFGGRQVVAGFTLQAMISYYVISALLSQLDMSEGIAGELAHRIRDGTFSKYMVIPAGVERYLRWQTLGAMAMYMIFNLLAVLVWVLVFRIEFTIASDALTIAGAVLMVCMGLVFMTQLNFFLGILTFKFENIGTFLMIKNNIIEFVTGAFVPLALLPGAVVAAMRFLPFYYVTYLPSMLLIGQNGEELAAGLCILLGWIISLAAVNRVTYGRLRRKYDGVGI